MLLAVLGDERDAIITGRVGGTQRHALVVDPSPKTVPSAECAEVLQRTLSPDKRMIHRGNVSKGTDKKLSRQIRPDYLPKIVYRSRQAAVTVAERQVLANSVAPEPEVWAAGTVHGPNDFALLIDSPGFRHSRTGALDNLDDTIANVVRPASGRSCTRTEQRKNDWDDPALDTPEQQFLHNLEPP